jgi:hypothetical protein
LKFRVALWVSLKRFNLLLQIFTRLELECTMQEKYLDVRMNFL